MLHHIIPCRLFGFQAIPNNVGSFPSSGAPVFFNLLDTDNNCMGAVSKLCGFLLLLIYTDCFIFFTKSSIAQQSGCMSKALGCMSKSIGAHISLFTTLWTPSTSAANVSSLGACGIRTDGTTVEGSWSLGHAKATK